MIDYLEVGQRIARIRKSIGLTQFEVCEMCNLSDKYLSNIEKARSIPSVDVLMRICKALNTTPDALLLGVNRNENNTLINDTTELLKLLDEHQLSYANNFIKWLYENKTMQKPIV